MFPTAGHTYVGLFWKNGFGYCSKEKRLKGIKIAKPLLQVVF